MSILSRILEKPLLGHISSVTGVVENWIDRGVNCSFSDVMLKMTDPSMFYMYTQRHLMQYGGEYGPALVRGQYASDAYNNSKATLAGKIADVPLALVIIFLRVSVESSIKLLQYLMKHLQSPK